MLLRFAYSTSDSLQPAQLVEGRACTKLAIPMAMLTLLLLVLLAAAAALVLDLRHFRLLSSLLQIPAAQLAATDPQSLELGALRSLGTLTASKRRLLSAHLRALRVTVNEAPPEAAAAAEALCAALPVLPEYALGAAPHELAAVQGRPRR